MRLARAVAVSAALAAGALLAAPLSAPVLVGTPVIVAALVASTGEATAQTKRRATRLTVRPRSYLDPGREVTPRTSYDYLIDVRYRPIRPNEFGPGGNAGFVNLPQPFDPIGQGRGWVVDFRAPAFLMW